MSVKTDHFSAQAGEQFTDLAINGFVAEDRFLTKTVDISLMVDVVERIAGSVMLRLESLGYDGRVDVDSLTRAMTTVLQMRIDQVCRKKPLPGVRITDIPVWSILFGVLAQIGKYRDEQAGIELVPTSAAVVSMDDFEHLKTVVSSLTYWGMSYSYGLPKEIYVEDETIFTLVVSEGNVYGTKDVPAPITVMSRIFFEMCTVTEAFGESRVQYATIRYLQQVFEDTVGKHLRNPSSVKT